MKVFVCRICGEIYIGEEIPKTCPFCGVANKYFRMASTWIDEDKGVELTDISRKNLEKALEIELSNTAFYKSAWENISNLEVALMFKGLSKVEREHASVFKKLLGLSDVPIVEEACKDDPEAAMHESSQREQRAVEFYTKALSEATEERVITVFEAIMNTEKDHLALDQECVAKLK